MYKNMGVVDKISRVAIASAVVALYLFDHISGLAAVILLVLSAVLVLTTLFGTCPLYLPFGISTKSKST